MYQFLFTCLHYTGLQETMYKLFACLLYTIKVINIYMLTLHYIKVTYMFTIFLFTFYITSCTNKTKSILSSNPLPMLWPVSHSGNLQEGRQLCRSGLCSQWWREGWRSQTACVVSPCGWDAQHGPSVEQLTVSLSPHQLTAVSSSKGKQVCRLCRAHSHQQETLYQP